MLRVEEITGRTYEERMTDAYAALPLISKEWTNYNPSDPGITILENLVVFESLQGSNISNLSYETRLALLKMAGFTPGKAKCARVLLTPEDPDKVIRLNANQKFKLGSMIFETRKAVNTGGMRLEGIFSHYDDEFHNFSFLSDRDYRMSARVFGEKPREGDSIYFISNALPEPGSDTFFYINMDTRFNRNPVEDRSDNIFASLKWECFTSEGFKEIKVRDFTGAFLLSGEIKFRLPSEKAVPYQETPLKGYCIRATLTHASYDVVPRFRSVNAFLFEAWQKDSRSLSITSQKTETIEMVSPFKNEDYLLVFGKEKKGSSYRRYELTMGGGARGRYCLYRRGENGRFTLTFDEESFGYAPIKTKDTVRVVIYSEEIMRRYRVGKVLGYDDQEIELPVKHIVPDSFCLIAKRTEKDGSEIFDFVRPGKGDDDALTFHLLENDGKIVIEDAGDFIGADLFMAGCAVTEGPRGNIRAGNIIRAIDLPGEPGFFNPGPGNGGAYRETLDEVKARFRRDILKPYTCVTAGDYERVVSETPGLCIRKIRAVMDELENLVHIAVMPGTDGDFPVLSEEYKKAINSRLQERRLITTRFQILSPVYVGVSVKSTVYVKRHFTDCREQIENVLKRELDYAGTEKNFGDPLKFEEVFRALEELECVEFVYELFIRPENSKYAGIREANIYPAENCLLYPGRLEIEIVTYEKG
ncbi:MAG: baseplate J/gp47 family protein [Lachnospiraceae bacterium]|nr:baseplate J/gp47 family protein [Lachnospiraceae bacterium]